MCTGVDHLVRRLGKMSWYPLGMVERKQGLERKQVGKWTIVPSNPSQRCPVDLLRVVQKKVTFVLAEGTLACGGQ